MNNAISSGVKEAKHTQKDVLKALGDANKFLGPAVKDAKKAIIKTENELADLVDKIDDEIKEALQKPDAVVEVVEESTPVVVEEVEQSTPIVEMASPTSSENACGKDEALNMLGSNKCTEHGECDGARTCSNAGWCQGVSGCDTIVIAEDIIEVIPEKEVVEIVETPEEEVVEVVEIKQEIIEEAVKPAMVEDLFSIEEKEAMQTLAEMGRLFDDEDEARMVQLTEDLTAWINKYAATFEDPEALLFEVTASLVTEEMEMMEPIPEAPETPVTPVTPEEPI